MAGIVTYFERQRVRDIEKQASHVPWEPREAVVAALRDLAKAAAELADDLEEAGRTKAAELEKEQS